jgi:hypothetical protein
MTPTRFHILRASGAEESVQVRAAGGEAGVFVSAVDDPALGALVGVAQDFQLGQVGLPRAARGEGDGVVVVLRPPVPGDQARCPVNAPLVPRECPAPRSQ